MLKSFKFQFEVIVEKVEIAIAFACHVAVIWKRGSNKIETKNNVQIESGNQAIFNEKLTMTSNMYFNETTKCFSEKKTLFTVVLMTSKGNKVAGSYTLDLGQIINNKVVELKENYRLEKCPDKNAKIFLNIKTIFMGEVKDVEAMSVAMTNNLNESFESLNIQMIDQLNKEREKTSLEDITIPSKLISIDTRFEGEKEKLIEKLSVTEEKLKSFQKENQLLKSELNNNEIKMKSINENLENYDKKEREKYLKENKELKSKEMELEKKINQFKLVNEHENQKFKLEKEKYETEINNNKNEIEFLKKQLNEKKDTVINTEIKEKDNLKFELKDLYDKKNNLEKEIFDLKNQIQELISDNKKLALSNQNNIEKINNLENTLKEFKNLDLEGNNIKEIERLKNEKIESETNLKQKILAYQTNEIKLKFELSNLKNNQNTDKMTTSENSESLKLKDKEISLLQNELNNFKFLMKENNEKISIYEEKIYTLEKKINNNLNNSNKEENTQLQIKLEEMTNANILLEKKINLYSKEMEARFKKILQESEKKTLENKELIKKLDELTLELEKNEISNQKNNDSILCEKLNKENLELKKEVDVLTDNMVLFQEKINALQQKLSSDRKGSNHDSENLKAKIHELELQRSKLENEFSQSKMIWAKANNELGQLREEVINGKKKLAKMKELEEKYEISQEELRTNKQRIGDAINIAFEIGGESFADKLLNGMKF